MLSIFILYRETSNYRTLYFTFWCRYEAQFVQSIVENVSKHLDPKIFHVPLHFIGRDALVQYINSWLQDGSHGAAIALLYGIGGVGKTAITKSVLNQNFYKFEGKSFLSNFRSKHIVCLQRQLLSDILKKTVDEINDEDKEFWRLRMHYVAEELLLF